MEQTQALCSPSIEDATLKESDCKDYHGGTLWRLRLDRHNPKSPEDGQIDVMFFDRTSNGSLITLLGRGEP